MANSSSSNLLLWLAVLAGGYVLYQRGTFNQILDKIKIPFPALPLPTPQLPGTSPTPTTPIPLPSPSTGAGSAGFDQYGIRKIYPDAVGGQTLTTFKHMRGTRNYSSRKPSTSTDEYYIEPIPSSFVDCEATGYLKVTATSNDSISIKMRGGHHGDQNPNEGSCYIFNLYFDGTQVIKKEKPHPKDHTCSYPPKFKAGSIKGKWIGFKGITYNEGSGVRLQQWVDEGGIINGKPANQWKLGIDALDTGNCYQAPYTKPNGFAFFYRIDDTKSTEFQMGSLRRIKPGPLVSSYAKSYFDTQRKITLG